MSAAYYDLYGEEGALFVVKLNILDKDGVSVNLLDKSNGKTLYIPEELKAIGVTEVTDIKATLSLKSNLFEDEALMFFTTDSTVYTGNDTIGRISLKEGSKLNPNLDHNVILYRKMTESIVISGVPTALELVDGGIGIGAQEYVTDVKGTKIKLTVNRKYNDTNTVHPYTSEKPYPYAPYTSNTGSSLSVYSQNTFCTGTVTSATIVSSSSNYALNEEITFKSISPDMLELYNSKQTRAIALIKNKNGRILAGSYTCPVNTVSSMPRYFNFKISTPYCSNWGETPAIQNDFEDKCSVPHNGTTSSTSLGTLDTTLSYTDTQRYVPIYPFKWTGKINGGATKTIPASGAWSDVELKIGDRIKFPIIPTGYQHTNTGPNSDLPTFRADWPEDCDGFRDAQGNLALGYCSDGLYGLLTIEDISFPNATIPCFDANGNVTTACQQLTQQTNAGGVSVPSWVRDYTTANISGYLDIVYKVNGQDKIAEINTSEWQIYRGNANNEYKIKFNDDTQCISRSSDGKIICDKNYFWAVPFCQAYLAPRSTGIGRTNCNIPTGAAQFIYKSPSANSDQSAVASNSMPVIYEPSGTRNNQIIGQMYEKTRRSGSSTGGSDCISASTYTVTPPSNPSSGTPCVIDYSSTFRLSCDANTGIVDRWITAADSRSVNTQCYNWDYNETGRGDYRTKIIDNGCGCNVGLYLTDVSFNNKIPDKTYDLTGQDNDLIRFTSPILKVSEVKSTAYTVLGTHFYDLEFTFTTKSGSSTETVDYTLRMIQGKFVITPEVTKT